MTPDLESAKATLKRWEREEETNRILGYEWDVAESLGWAVGDIERLQAALLKSENSNVLRKRAMAQGERQIASQATRIAELEADLEQSEICIRARMDVIDQQAVRIRELEEGHKRAGAKYAKIINELRSSVYVNVPGLLRSEGKISSGDHIVETNEMIRLTPERKAALERIVAYMHHMFPIASPYYHCTDDENLVRTMLDEARP